MRLAGSLPCWRRDGESLHELNAPVTLVGIQKKACIALGNRRPRKILLLRGAATLRKLRAKIVFRKYTYNRLSELPVQSRFIRPFGQKNHASVRDRRSGFPALQRDHRQAARDSGNRA